MNPHNSLELGAGSGASSRLENEIHQIDDIPREIVRKRLEGEFGDLIKQEQFKALQEQPDIVENRERFEESAKGAGIKDTEGLLGWATTLESPAHALRGDVGREIATLIHEDLHRLTHPLTRAEMGSTQSRNALYEGLTEHYTDKATEGLHGHTKGECYAEGVHDAQGLEKMVGEDTLRQYFFKHEMPEAIAKAIELLKK